MVVIIAIDCSTQSPLVMSLYHINLKQAARQKNHATNQLNENQWAENVG